jgi:hypothetical protein
MDDVLEIPNLWGQLRPRDSPFVSTNYYGGGFADEDDRVALSSIHFASKYSTGARDECRPRSKVMELTLDDDVSSRTLSCACRVLSIGKVERRVRMGRCSPSQRNDLPAHHSHNSCVCSRRVS